ncbi:hypothetical protein [Marivita sp. XM-24bin2]|uniref:hypothetical protein n=1 Tax=unclassified Marivita TaxID=2632480 RepID=UPI000D79AE27|nr:hypothetical protein [Marivita sp. XM-24bin2]MCR9111598.1 hypothetical protein [Paracoccaceae bacterium]PWL34673.1 MAG: hypothetical protein DCO97_13410 [Marivita sp. XM-24bin2]
MKTLIAATALALTAVSASAMVDTSSIDQYAPNVDVSTLTDAEVNTILSVIHSGDSNSEKRALIQALVK